MTRSVLAWLEQAAALTPEAPAFEDVQSSLTFGQLYAAARGLGSFVAKHTPLQTPVLLMMDKSPLTVAAMLGTAYAGCFYTPVDASMPLARLKLIVDQLEPALALCGRKYLPLAEELGLRSFTVEDAIAPADDALLEERQRRHIDTDLLYVLFTSGSTGTPKGVAVSHRSVIDFVEWASSALRIEAGSRFGNQAPLYFDNSVLDVYGAIRTRSCVFFLPRMDFMFPSRLLEDLRHHAIDTIFWVPSALTAVAASGLLQPGETELKRVFFCGEVMPCRTLNVWRKALPEARFVNMYGPTEITDVCAWFEVDRDFNDDDALPIGFPCANTRIELLDGEICVMGTCLAAGYYNAPEKTAEAFVRNPLRPQLEERMYRTGDLGAYNERGELLFLGRRDSQIKKNGYRIELGEIECALLALEGVEQGCCVFDAPTSRIICAWAGPAGKKQVQAGLKGCLPKYMLPDELLRMERLPQTGSGKIDRVSVRQVANGEHPEP